jgi:DNA-binding GntR family transcriptional regulator
MTLHASNALCAASSVTQLRRIEMSALSDDALLVAGQAISLRALVVERLRLAIVTGRFAPGSQLRERELCELTGVSRPLVREALRQLEAEGLVSAFANRGSVVTKMTPEEVTKIYDLRSVLESFAAREFARLRLPKDIDALQRAVGRLDEVEDHGSPLEILQVGSAIHSAITTGSGNPYLAEALGTLHNRIALIRFISLHQRSRIGVTFSELRALSAAIVSGDVKQADELCTRHLRDIGALAKRIVEAGYRLPDDADETTLPEGVLAAPSRRARKGGVHRDR